MEKSELSPVIKFFIFCVGLYALLNMLYIGKGIIVPIMLSGLIAIILRPVVKFLLRKGFNRFPAIMISFSLAFLLAFAIGSFMVSQFTLLNESLPVLLDRLRNVAEEGIVWSSKYFNVDEKRIYSWIDNMEAELFKESSSLIGNALGALMDFLVLFFLIPIYVIMILYYEPLFIVFLQKVFGADNNLRVVKVLTQIKSIIQRYMNGLLIEAGLVATFYSVSFFIVGIDYAVLFGVIGALLNLIPYVGSIVAAVLPMTMALITKSSLWYPVAVLGLCLCVQFIDNNIVVPKIVGSRVKINAVVAVVSVIAMGAFWGIPGMFMSLPLLAITKVVFDNIEFLEPYGYLLGDSMPESEIKKKIKKKA